MFTWNYEESVPTVASAEQVWALWSNPCSWNQWDAGIEWVKLNGAFEVGSKGTLKPAGGPAVKYILLEVRPGCGFKDRSFLPLTHLDFIHSYTPPSASGEAARITHRVEMSGWLTPLFRIGIGSGIKKGLPDTLRKLARIAEDL